MHVAVPREEFLAIMPGASLADAREIAERIRHMSQESVCHEQDHEIRFTVSLGYASYPEQRMESAEDLLRCADQALYRAKEGGRNQAIAAPSLAVTVQSNPNGNIRRR